MGKWQRWVSDINPSRAVSYLDWVMPIIAMRKECTSLESAMQDGREAVCNSGLWQLFLHHQTSGFEEIENQLKEKAEGASLRLLSYMDGRIPSWAAS